jgi:hypothetical protein
MIAIPRLLINDWLLWRKMLACREVLPYLTLRSLHGIE